MPPSMLRVAAALAILCGLTVQAHAFDLQSTTVPGRAAPSLTNGEIAINRADGGLSYKAPDGSIARGLLPDIDASGYLKFRNGLTLGRWQGNRYIATPDRIEIGNSGSTGPIDGMTVGGTALSSVLAAKAPMASPVFTGTPSAPALSLTGSGLSGPVDSGTVGGASLSSVLGSKAPVAGPSFTGILTAPEIVLNGPGLSGPVGGGLVAPRAGTNARSLAARAAEVVNAADYGVACDGARDVTAPLRAAAAVASAKLPLYIPPQPGACLLSNNFSVPSGTTVYAVPGTVALKPTSGNTANPALFLSVVQTGVTVQGIAFDGGGSNHANDATLAVVYRGDAVVMDSTEWRDTRGAAILYSESRNSGARNSKFTNIGNYWKTSKVATDRKPGVLFTSGTPSLNTGNFVIGNTFSGVGLDDISASEVTDIRIANNSCVHDDSQAAIVSLPDYPACVYTTNVYGGAITGNVATRPYGNGLDLHTSPGLAVTGNKVIGAGAAGIGLFGSSYSTISGNTILNGNQTGYTNPVNCQGGICLGGTLTAVSISGNVSTDNQPTKTQTYGIHGVQGTATTNSYIDQSNVLGGNKTAPLGGTVSAYGAQ